MVRPHRAVAMAAVALALTARADGNDAEVLRVGDTVLRVSDIEGRLAKVPAFQRNTYGTTDTDIRRRFVDGVLVPELLVAEDAKQRKLAAKPRAARRIREALSRALGDAVLDAETAAGAPDAEVGRYYDAHRADYEKPERIRISRILVDDEALARKILAESKGAAGFERWTELARESSLDAATKMRGGMLGFVYPDGHTEAPQVAVDPALYAAAAKVRDGELVPEPVKEGARFAVVWRRGTLAKTSRSLETEHDAIVSLLIRERAEKAFAALEADLRRKSLKDLDPGPLENLAVDDDVAPGAARPRPSAAPGGDPVPRATERGLR